MSLIQTIKDAQLTARKARDGVRASLLTTLIGEAEMVGKSEGNRETTDAEVLVIMRKFEKDMNANIAIFEKTEGSLLRLQLAHQERRILAEFLPQKVSDEQVRRDIEFGIKTANLPLEMKSMGAISKALRQAYGEQYDGAQVKNIFNEFLI